jgi:hypothetical protein
MNEKYIQQVIAIERKAQEIQDAAIREAQQLPSRLSRSQALISRGG